MVPLAHAHFRVGAGHGFGVKAGSRSAFVRATVMIAFSVVSSARSRIPPLRSFALHSRSFMSRRAHGGGSNHLRRDGLQFTGQDFADALIRQAERLQIADR